MKKGKVIVLFREDYNSPWIAQAPYISDFDEAAASEYAKSMITLGYPEAAVVSVLEVVDRRSLPEIRPRT